MSQRPSGYARKERDLYETPEWVTAALGPHMPRQRLAGAWEPACGSGKMVRTLEIIFDHVWGTDIEPGGVDFLMERALPEQDIRWDAIITNPPYELAQQFCDHALRLMEPVRGVVAMLLRTDFDHAQSRQHLFRDCPAFAKKLVLMKRIAWFVEANGKPKASPSFNHAWYIWDHAHDGPPTISYGP